MDAAIGRYKVEVSIRFRQRKVTKTLDEPLTILFNPWSPDDEVYLGSQEELREYVLLEDGIVYRNGGRASVDVSPKAWNYDQFDAVCFAAALQLVGRLPRHERHSAVLVARRFAALANAQDDRGVLVGNWSGNYSDGAAPWQWNGSREILKAYLRSGEPVKYGQCWVFSGLLVTLMRALGVPARSVTNYGSAHDTHSNRSIEFYYDGNTRLGHISDSIWNFHVWNEVWMRRGDLPPGRDGWQAIDATPQEVSGGKYQMGPASVVSVQKGEATAYDAEFVIAEVNGDVRQYRREPGARWHLFGVDSTRVGRLVVTKAVGRREARDITGNYKHAEGSVSERVQALRANGGPEELEFAVEFGGRAGPALRRAGGGAGGGRRAADGPHADQLLLAVVPRPPPEAAEDGAEHAAPPVPPAAGAAAGGVPGVPEGRGLLVPVRSARDGPGDAADLHPRRGLRAGAAAGADGRARVADGGRDGGARDVHVREPAGGRAVAGAAGGRVDGAAHGAAGRGGARRGPARRRGDPVHRQLPVGLRLHYGYPRLRRG